MNLKLAFVFCLWSLMAAGCATPAAVSIAGDHSVETLARSPAGRADSDHMTDKSEIEGVLKDQAKTQGFWATFIGHANSEDPDNESKDFSVEETKALAREDALQNAVRMCSNSSQGRIQYLATIKSLEYCETDKLTQKLIYRNCYAKAIVNCSVQMVSPISGHIHKVIYGNKIIDVTGSEIK